MNNRFYLPCIFILSTLVTSCSTVQSTANDTKAMVIEPAPNVGFIEHPEKQVKHADMPFQKTWVKPGFHKSNYQEIVIAPVNTQYMLEMDWLHEVGSANLLTDIKADFAELADYFRKQLVTAFENDPNHRFRVLRYAVNHTQPALRLEVALIEADPSEPILHAAGWLVLGGGTAAGLVNQRRAAFEARLRDLQTGEIVATFADRDMQDMGPLDLTRLTWFGPAKGIIDQWAEQFVQLANRKPGELVTDPVPLTLRPF